MIIEINNVTFVNSKKIICFMSSVYLLLGGNISDRFSYLGEAITNLKNIGIILNQSSIYETEPWGFSHENNFLNQAVLLKTNLSPELLLHKIHKIEHNLGRVRSSKQYSERVIDIDILFYNNHIIDNENLAIPHKRLHERLFTLIPLNEIAPDLIHPVFTKKIKSLLSECNDILKVKKVALSTKL